jgi:hypothetical protein
MGTDEQIDERLPIPAPFRESFLRSEGSRQNQIILRKEYRGQAWGIQLAKAEKAN